MLKTTYRKVLVQKMITLQSWEVIHISSEDESSIETLSKAESQVEEDLRIAPNFPKWKIISEEVGAFIGETYIPDEKEVVRFSFTDSVKET